MINAAIVGIGRWGQHLVESVQGKSEHIKFTAGVTRTRSKAEKFCGDQNIELRDDYAELTNDPGIDAVVLATPHTQHEKQIVEAANAGKHVFTEKPFTLDKASAERAVAACKNAGVTLALGHNRRFMKNTERLKEMVDAGELGTLMHIDGNQSADLNVAAGAWRDSREESPAGGMTSLGVHALDCIMHLAGKISAIDAYSTRRAISFDIDDTTAALLRFENGMTGTLVTLASTPRIWHIRIAGSAGWAEMRDNKTLTVCKGDGMPKDITFDDTPYPHLESLSGELDEFAQAVEGNAIYRISPKEMVHNAEVLAGLINSAETGNRVTFS
ncbi:MAG: oxidoreductase [Rhodospirillaceae bacterium]|nr:oxidoreductase [Rhodospirillaceae bacterium]|tara:strand:+ start:5609 stop:6592 length:984 start_codon:yes stop_codon:yes gene_type:complete